ncbi:hypothetical protein Bca4012_074875 [Brassica carinata]
MISRRKPHLHRSGELNLHNPGEIQNRLHGYYSRKLDQKNPNKSTTKVPAKSNTGSLDKKKGFTAPVLCQIAAASAIVYIFYRLRQWTPTSLPSKFGHFVGILDIRWSQRRSGMLQFVNRLIDMSNIKFKCQLFETKRKVLLWRFLVVFHDKSIKKMTKQGPND